MSFNSPAKLFIVALSLVSLGCNLKTGDWVPPGDKGKLDSYDCLSNVAEDARKYINGDSDSKKIGQTLSCVKDALEEFSEISRGARTDGFSPEELSGFLNDKFLEDSQITKELLKELMEVKVAVAGGSYTFVTKDEFGKLIKLTETLRPLTEMTAPYMKLYRNMLSEEDRNNISNSQDLEAAKEVLNYVAVVLGEWLQHSASSYKVGTLSGLIEQSRIFLKWDKLETDSKSPEELTEMFEVFKLLVVGSRIEEGQEVIVSGQWKELFSAFSSSYGVYLNYIYMLKSNDVLRGQGLKDLIGSLSGANGIFINFEEFIAKQEANEECAEKYANSNEIEKNEKINKNCKAIKFDLINRTLKILFDLKLFPAGLRLEESIIPTVRYIIEKVMRDLNVPLSEAKTEGLQIGHVQEIEKEFLNWAYGQLILSGESKSLPEESIVNRNLPVKEKAEKEIEKLLNNNDLRQLYAGADDARVWITHDSDRTHSFEGLTRLNIIKLFARLLIRGFAEEPERASETIGITEQEAINFYREAKKIGVDLEFMDDRKSNVGARFFKEANLFTFSGDGINQDIGGIGHLLTLQESIEQLALVYSGSRLRDLIYDDALEHTVDKKIGSDGESVFTGFVQRDGSFGKVILDRDKLLERLTTVSYKYINNMPLMVQYLDEIGLEGRLEFFGAMLDISHHPSVSKDLVEYGELATLATLAHYIEVVFHRYDVLDTKGGVSSDNSDGIMDGREVMRAYSSFRGFLIPEIRRITGSDKTEGQTKGIFSFLLSRGTIPEEGWLWKGDNEVIAYWDLQHFNDDPHQFDGRCERKWYLPAFAECSTPEMEVTRSDIMRVLGLLSSSTRQPAD